MENTADIANAFDWNTFVPLGINLLKAAGVLILGWVISRWAGRVIRKRLGNSKGLRANDTLRPLIAVVTKYTIMLGALYAALKIVGIPPESLLAVFGAAGLAIALSVQGTLSNIAAGMMLIFLRSIKVGEYIETASAEGTVLEIGLFTTELKSSKGVFVTVPNAQLWASKIKNYSRFHTRRIDVSLEISRENDLAAAVSLMEKTLRAQDTVVNKDAADVVVSGFTPRSAILQARCWMKSGELRTESSALRLALHEALQKGGFELPPLMMKD